MKTEAEIRAEAQRLYDLAVNPKKRIPQTRARLFLTLREGLLWTLGDMDNPDPDDLPRWPA